MSTATPAAKPPSPPERHYAPLAGFLSYLIPGLGQIYQGRVGKGLLFMVCIYTLFFYGMHLGSWSNVYLPDASALPKASLGIPWVGTNGWPLSGVPKALYYRTQFLGQFWVGIVAWPAILQYGRVGDEAPLPLLGLFERTPYESRAAGPDHQRFEAPQNWPGKTLNELQSEGDKSFDLGWVYTVIAGVLNVMVIYDAFAGPAFSAAREGRRSLQEVSAA